MRLFFEICRVANRGSPTWGDYNTVKNFQTNTVVLMLISQQTGSNK